MRSSMSSCNCHHLTEEEAFDISCLPHIMQFYYASAENLPTVHTLFHVIPVTHTISGGSDNPSLSTMAVNVFSHPGILILECLVGSNWTSYFVKIFRHFWQEVPTRNRGSFTLGRVDKGNYVQLLVEPKKVISSMRGKMPSRNYKKFSCLQIKHQDSYLASSL